MTRQHVTGLRSVVILGSMALAACTAAAGDSDNQPALGEDAIAVASKVVNVSTDSVALTEFTDYLRITGEVAALNDVTVSAEETGVVTEFSMERGRRVRRGDVLARLDNSVLRAEAAEARAAAGLAQEQFERQRRLWEDEQIGSEIAFLQARYQAEIQQARLDRLEARLAKTTIRSPIAGIFDDKFLEVGEMAAPGIAVLRVVAIDRVKILGGVPERFAPFVHSGDPAVITFDILPDRELQGKIEFVGSSVDQRSRTFLVEVIIDNPDGVVKPQMVANMELQRSHLTDVIVVPQEVVVRTELGYQVFVAVERDGGTYAEAHAVRLGPGFEDRVVIEEGLSPGDRLIVAGVQLVDDGSRVKIVSVPGA